MKHLRETFTDEEFADLKKVKESSGLNWHDLIMTLTLGLASIEFEKFTSDEIKKLQTPLVNPKSYEKAVKQAMKKSKK